MRVSYRWLRELVVGLPDVAEVARRLTMGGLEVESIEAPTVSFGGRLVVARITELSPHPNADRLTVCRVDDGTASRTIVCGARNMVAGDAVVLASPGCTLPGGATIGKAKLRGVESEGMLCSAEELGLARDGDGILILDRDSRAGADAAEMLGLDDIVLEVAVTPNRGDCLSMIGIAREAAALCGLSFDPTAAVPATAFAVDAGASGMSVSIEDPRCVMYRGLTVRGLTVRPSPAWLRWRLRACGLRPINNLVDVTNLVLMEQGQPLHAFDLAKLRGRRITVRSACEAESLRTLDGRDLVLQPSDLVIADDGGAVALAGVMGGERSAVSESTCDVFLESAVFAPAAVRRTSRRLGVVSDSSYRFERGVDSERVELALSRAATLLVSLGGGTVEGGVVGAGEPLPQRPPTRLRLGRVRSVLGVDVSGDQVSTILDAIGAEAVRRNDGFEVRAPSHRNDLDREVDFIEEIARIRGYDEIPDAMPRLAVRAVQQPRRWTAERELRRLLSGIGLCEHVAVAFASTEMNGRFAGPFPTGAKAVTIRNPLRSDACELARSTFPALLEALRANVASGQSNIDLFTIARTFAVREDGSIDQRHLVGGLLYGPRPGSRPGSEEGLTFAHVRAVLDKSLGLLTWGARPTVVATSARPEFHPLAAATISLAEDTLGYAGRLHPDLAEAYEIAGEIYLFEFDCQEAVIYRPGHPGLRPISRYPSSKRDVSLLLAADVPASAAIEVVEGLGDPCIESAFLFDEYRGDGIEGGWKALGYSVVYRAADRTLTDAEVEALHGRVVGLLTERLGAKVRA